MDDTNISGVAFLITVFRQKMYLTVEWIQNQTPEAHMSVLYMIFCKFNHGGFGITTIKFDYELSPLMKELQDTYIAKNN